MPLLLVGIGVAMAVKKGLELINTSAKHHEVIRVAKELKEDPEVRNLKLWTAPIILSKEETFALQVMGGTKILSNGRDRAESPVGEKMLLIQKLSAKHGGQ